MVLLTKLLSLAEGTKSYIWIPYEEWKSLDFNTLMGVIASWGYMIIAGIATAVISIRVMMSVFHYFQGRTSITSVSRIDMDHIASAGAKDIIASLMGIVLIWIGPLILQILIKLVFPEYIWIIQW